MSAFGVKADIAVWLSASRLPLHVDKLWRLCKIMKQRRAQPALHIELLRPVPIAPSILPLPIKAVLMTRERCGREDHRKALLCVRNIRNNTIDHPIGAGNKGLLVQANSRIVKTHMPRCLQGAMTLIAFMGSTRHHRCNGESHSKRFLRCLSSHRNCRSPLDSSASIA
jgi:hypothetical protein